MKQLIRKWLGIKDIDNEHLRQLVAEALIFVISGNAKYSSWGYYIKDTYGVQGLVRKVALEQYKKQADTALEAAKRSTENEEFIDKVVDRIKRKQLV